MQCREEAGIASKIFLPFYRLLFTWLTIFLAIQELSMRPHLSSAGLTSWASGTPCLHLRVSCSMLPSVSSSSFSFRLMLRLSFVQGERQGSSFIFYMWVSRFSSQHLWWRCYLCSLCICSVFEGLKSGIFILFHWSSYLSLSQYHARYFVCLRQGLIM